MAKECIKRDNAKRAFAVAFQMPENMIDAVWIQEVLDAIPAVDVEPVVRCKDCKYGVPTKNGLLNDMIACENKDSPCGYSSWLCQLDWFCADGERREVQDDN